MGLELAHESQHSDGSKETTRRCIERPFEDRQILILPGNMLGVGAPVRVQPGIHDSSAWLGVIEKVAMIDTLSQPEEQKGYSDGAEDLA